ncbi:MAG TPA: TIGR04283 family arsenosugar biosynthesis glycosyltransferase [Candidatus Solibacter sp.]|jgi:rSAM/selenodomain-associated transferase 2|nr:TIGR04283 family arsenosugar biosynthesis glycosyltransferase [Candidatus Solibacter sp.]
MTVSVVIPALNEVENLPRLIASLQQIDSVAEDVAEIIVADGGSTDGMREWVLGQPDLAQQCIVLVDSPRGKGPQLNAGAARATGDFLLFLHADCQMERAAWLALQSAVSQPQIAGGAFHIRFAESAPSTLRLVERGINVRTSVTRTATGDQGIFVRRNIFFQIGSAPDWPLFEDVELVRRIKKVGRFVVIKNPLTISGRRYIEYGVVRTALLIFALRLGFWLGVSPHRLKGWFKDVRKRPPAPPLSRR